MLKLSDESFGFSRPKASKSWSVMPSFFSAYPPRCCSMRAGVKRSKPAATAVCVVKRFPARVAASATSKGCPGAFQDGEGRMAFIQVADFRLDAERVEQPPSADS